MFTATPQDMQYLTDTMGKVSRSFALVVAQLEAPLNLFMATAYLLCRVADNIEDSLRPISWQQQRFSEFGRLLHDPTLAPDILARWTREKWPGLSADEQTLMGFGGGTRLWKIYATLPGPTQQVIADWVLVMAQGMAQLEEATSPPLTTRHNGIRLLVSEQDYNRYCYFVAGTVGYLGTELVVAHYELADDVAQRLYDTCEACGRGLQKTNIIKDFAEDLQRQICYLPATWLREAQYAPLALEGAPRAWKQRVINDVQDELHQALEHVLTVPPSAAGYRKASLLCLLPALRTLLLAAQKAESLFTPQHYVKISRQTMLQCVLDAQSIWMDNDAILRHCLALEEAIANAFERRPVENWPAAAPSAVGAAALASAPEPQGQANTR
jgi:farnesyl-diphosphate farnesyltransferase